jgi:hypothetical protein
MACTTGAFLDRENCTEVERSGVRTSIRFTEGEVATASCIDRAFESPIDELTPLLRVALGLTALVITAPGRFSLSWTAINEFKAGFLLAGALDLTRCVALMEAKKRLKSRLSTLRAGT